MWYHPWVGLPWWGFDVYPSPQPPLYVAVTRNIPEGTVPIREGVPVFSRDDKNLGEVEKVYTEPDENRITHLMLSKGIFSKENKLIPTYWVDSVEENEVRLGIDSEVVESLPEGTLV